MPLFRSAPAQEVPWAEFRERPDQPDEELLERWKVRPDEDASEPVKFGVFPISGLLMLRYPLLKDGDYPRGRLQPYAGVGPGAFVTTARIDVEPAGTEVSIDTTVAAGLDVRGGVNFLFTGWESPGSLAIILEYRFTHFEPSDFKDKVGGVPIELGSDQWDTHHVVAGVGWYF